MGSRLIRIILSIVIYVLVAVAILLAVRQVGVFFARIARQEWMHAYDAFTSQLVAVALLVLMMSVIVQVFTAATSAVIYYQRGLLDPNIASILLSIGSLAILVELYNPGATIPAVVGVICLTLAAVALLGLPTNWAAVILIIAGFGMLVLDIKVTGFALSVGGVLSIILGLFFLFRPFTLPQQPQFEISVSPWVIAAITGTIALFFFVVLRAALATRHAPAIMGPKTYIGAHGVAVTDIGPQGTVHVRCEQWTAEADEPILRGDKIVVIGVDGLRVKVKKV